MPKRINAIPTEATSFADDDFIPLDGATNNSRKLRLGRVLAAHRNALAPRGGVAFDGATGSRASSKLAGQAFGTDSFSVVVAWEVWANVSGSSQAPVWCVGPTNDSTNPPSFRAYIESPALNIEIGNATGGRIATVTGFVTQYQAKPVVLATVRNGNSLQVYANGVALTFGESTYGTSVPNWGDSITSSNFVVGSLGAYQASAGKVYSASLYNLALSATDVLEIYELGGAVPERFKFGSQLTRITDAARNSVFTAGATDWSAYGSAVVSNDGANQRLSVTNATGGGGSRLTTGYDGTNFVGGRRVRVRGTVGGMTGAQTMTAAWVNGGGPVSGYSNALIVANGAFDAVVEVAPSAHPGFRFDGTGPFSVWLDDLVINPVGAVVHLPLNDGAGLQLRDDSSNRLHALMTPTGVAHVLPKNGGAFPLRFSTNTSGNQQALGAACVPLNCQILRVRARTQSGTSTVSLGNVSGGAQIVSAAALTTAWQVLTIVGGAHITTTQNLWVNSNNANVIEWDIELEEVRI